MALIGHVVFPEKRSEMPTETWGNTLFQAQLVLRQLAADGTTDRYPEELRLLADQMDKIRSDEWY